MPYLVLTKLDIGKIKITTRTKKDKKGLVLITADTIRIVR